MSFPLWKRIVYSLCSKTAKNKNVETRLKARWWDAAVVQLTTVFHFMSSVAGIVVAINMRKLIFSSTNGVTRVSIAKLSSLCICRSIAIDAKISIRQKWLSLAVRLSDSLSLRSQSFCVSRRNKKTKNRKFAVRRLHFRFCRVRARSQKRNRIARINETISPKLPHSHLFCMHYIRQRAPRTLQTFRMKQTEKKKYIQKQQKPHKTLARLVRSPSPPPLPPPSLNGHETNLIFGNKTILIFGSFISLGSFSSRLLCVQIGEIKSLSHRNCENYTWTRFARRHSATIVLHNYCTIRRTSAQAAIFEKHFQSNA